MEKKVLIKNENKIGETISQLNIFAEVLESNLNILDLYNQKMQLIDKKYIFEISTISDENSRSILTKYLNQRDPLAVDTSNTNLKLNNLIKILFAQKSSNSKLIDYPEIFEDLTPLTQLYITYRISVELENKDSFNFDFINNKVTVKNEIIDYINKMHTVYLSTRNQLKAFEIMKNIDSEIEKLKEIYNVNNDSVTNDLLYDIYKCYPLYNLNAPKKIDYHLVYNNIIAKVKD